MEELYNVQDLVKLFNSGQDSDSDLDHEEPVSGSNAKELKTKNNMSPYAKVETVKQNDNNENSDMNDEYINFSEDHDSGWKKTPKWDITYSQKVSTSDVFLQMGAKTPATASCEDMIVTIDLPGEHMQNIDIKVLSTQLGVNSPNFSLKIPLPQPVHTQKGNAKWDKDNEKLIVTLVMEREFDFINF